jgi:hypothetical protein
MSSDSNSSSSPLSAFEPSLARKLDLLAYYDKVVQEVQEESTVRNYLEFSQYAFRSCVHTFTHHELTTKETKCIQNVLKKQVAVSLRTSQRFMEEQSEKMKKDREEKEKALIERGKK